jgi:hypothetical protein
MGLSEHAPVYFQDKLLQFLVGTDTYDRMFGGLVHLMLVSAGPPVEAT